MYDGDTFTHEGRTFRVKMPYDTDHGAPWEECDGHGPVSEWTTRDKRPGEWVLHEDGRRRRYYDAQAAVRQAAAEGWLPADGQRPGETLRAARARAVAADFKWLGEWCRDVWCYVGVVVTLLDAEGTPTKFSASLWGVESSEDDYLAEVAHELAGEVLAQLPDEVEAEVTRLRALVG